jgi:hypothetical protein
MVYPKVMTGYTKPVTATADNTVYEILFNF